MPATEVLPSNGALPTPPPLQLKPTLNGHNSNSTSDRLQIINDQKQFTFVYVQVLSRLVMRQPSTGFDYNLVAVFGSQSTGKSTLLNRLFGTNFDVMDETKRQQTTKGIAELQQSSVLSPHSVSILYSQGFSTIPVISAFAKRGDIVVALLSRRGLQSRVLRFAGSIIMHLKNLEDVPLSVENERRKRRGPLTRWFIITDGMFEMDGAMVDLPKLIERKHKYKYRLILDENISFGTVGRTGRGPTERYNVPVTQIDMIVGSVGSALNSSGGSCAGSRIVADHQRINLRLLRSCLGAPGTLRFAGDQYLAEHAVDFEYAVGARAVIFDRMEAITIPSHAASPIIHIRLRSPPNPATPAPREAPSFDIVGEGQVSSPSPHHRIDFSPSRASRLTPYDSEPPSDHHIQGAMVPHCLNSFPAPLHLFTRVATSPLFFHLAPSFTPVITKCRHHLAQFDVLATSLPRPSQSTTPLQPAFTTKELREFTALDSSTNVPRSFIDGSRLPHQLSTLPSRERLVESHPHRIGSPYESPRSQNYVRLPRCSQDAASTKYDGGNKREDGQDGGDDAKTIKTVAATRRQWQRRRREDDHGSDDDDMKTVTATATTAKIIKTAAATLRRPQRRQRRHEDDQDCGDDDAKTQDDHGADDDDAKTITPRQRRRRYQDGSGNAKMTTTATQRRSRRRRRRCKDNHNDHGGDDNHGGGIDGDHDGDGASDSDGDEGGGWEGDRDDIM
ncbi:hypothetical protein EDB84DRAFT_1626068 [Lactarius hengduanensis]|nr:hypothetical protein EDB84DRAFT_1626068 [Lactarius hengduanensis]